MNITQLTRKRKSVGRYVDLYHLKVESSVKLGILIALDFKIFISAVRKCEKIVLGNTNSNVESLSS